MHRAYIGLGSNLGWPQRQILSAFEAIAAIPGVTLLARSSLYKSAPQGYPDQPDFINACAAIATTLAPHELLQAVLAIERSQQRVRDFANAPRTLDLDILIYDALQITDALLTLPHPRCHGRAFVLYPLLEIAPDCVVPGRGPARELLRGVQDQAISRIAEEVTLRLAYGSFVGAT